MDTIDASRPQRFGMALRRARGDVGLSQKRLGELAGVSHVTICYIENGTTNYPHATTIGKLNKALEGRLDRWL